MLDVETPVFVVGCFAAVFRVAVGHRLRRRRTGPDRSSGGRGDEADSIARVEERRIQRIPRITAVPRVRRLPGDRARQAAIVVETDLTETLPPVGTSADAPGMGIKNTVASANHGLVAQPVRGSDARSRIDVVLLHGRVAMAAIDTVAPSELQRSGNPSGERIGERRIEERHHVIHFREGTPDVPAQAQVQGQTRGNFVVVLRVKRVRLITPTSLRNGVLRHHAAIDGAQQKTRIAEPGGG